MPKITFPENFLWGGAISAEQSEGHGNIKKGETIFDYHFKIKPNDFHNGVGPVVTSDFLTKYKEDIKLMHKHKINSFRTSLSWARIFPESDYSKPNKEAVAFYHSLIDECQSNGIELILTLFHFDLPMYAMAKGGFESREVWNDFTKYSAYVFEEFGSKVKTWTTMNEPWVPVQSSYISGIQVPFEKNEQKAVNAAYGIVMAHALVVNYFNEVVKIKYPENKIGGIFNSTVVYPKSNSQEDIRAAKYLELYQFTGMTDAMIGGKWNSDLVAWIKEMDLLPENFDRQDINILSKVNLDIVGLNFYQPLRAQAPVGNPKDKFQKYFNYYNMPGRRENKFRGWEIYPEALFDTFAIMSERYGKHKEYILSEYGMGVENEHAWRNNAGIIDDQYRVAFMKEHLQQLHRVINELGLNVIGAHAWAMLDCWSWNNSYKNRYGMIEVDIENQNRKPKSSLLFMEQTITEHGFDLNYHKMEHYMDFSKVKFTKSVTLE